MSQTTVLFALSMGGLSLFVAYAAMKAILKELDVELNISLPNPSVFKLDVPLKSIPFMKSRFRHNF